LLNKFGVTWFMSPGTMQLAVKQQGFETLEMLSEAGAE
jgi:hypothetical protein